jgi:hypothetical protein
VATAFKLDGVAKGLFIQLLRETGRARIRVFGISMLPTILPGDVIEVERGSANPGDIVVFVREGRLCAHRLLGYVNSEAITQGDGNPCVDSPFPFESILGRVTCLERNGMVINDLSIRPFVSRIIRNSQIARGILHIHNQLRMRAENRTPTATSRLAKLQG